MKSFPKENILPAKSYNTAQSSTWILRITAEELKNLHLLVYIIGSAAQGTLGRLVVLKSLIYVQCASSYNIIIKICCH